MNFNHLHALAEQTKKLYPPGTRLELISMSDPFSQVSHLEHCVLAPARNFDELGHFALENNFYPE